VRPFVIVVLTEFCQLLPRICQRNKPLHLQTFDYYSLVEAFRMCPWMFVFRSQRKCCQQDASIVSAKEEKSIEDTPRPCSTRMEFEFSEIRVSTGASHAPG
jgi:hypothetical protein